MSEASSQSGEYYRLVDKLRHALQYSEAVCLMVEDALKMVEAAKEDEDDGLG